MQRGIRSTLQKDPAKSLRLLLLSNAGAVPNTKGFCIPCRGNTLLVGDRREKITTLYSTTTALIVVVMRNNNRLYPYRQQIFFYFFFARP